MNDRERAFEVNFDGIVGPSHNYAGLSFGNVASTTHGQQVSNPKAAALQGLAKMRFVHESGIRQAILPPLHRPRLKLLREIGFCGSDAQVIDTAWKTSPQLLAACYSASNMWTANAATVSPSADCEDGKVHLTPANLNNSFHRAIEAETTTAVLRAIFSSAQFVIHDPLPVCATFSDEGAANHTRLCARYGDRGLEIFAFGRSALDNSESAQVPRRFPARQTCEASQAVARAHRLQPAHTMFLQQNPHAIDAGVFHNDVVSVGNQSVLLVYEMAYVDQSNVLEEMRSRFESACETDLHCIEFSKRELSIEDAVGSYLFNSQLLTRPGGGMTLLCPLETRDNAAAQRCTQRLLQESNPVDQVEFTDLGQSMNNGGGPACLRLRVVLTDAEWASVHPGVLFDAQLHDRLVEWVERHYREQLVPDDLRDPLLASEIHSAIDHLEQLLELPFGTLGANET